MAIVCVCQFSLGFHELCQFNIVIAIRDISILIFPDSFVGAVSAAQLGFKQRA